jgi:hypothetical protein
MLENTADGQSRETGNIDCQDEEKQNKAQRNMCWTSPHASKHKPDITSTNNWRPRRTNSNWIFFFIQLQTMIYFKVCYQQINNKKKRKSYIK